MSSLSPSPAAGPVPLRDPSHSILFRPIPVDPHWQRLLISTGLTTISAPPPSSALASSSTCTSSSPALPPSPPSPSPPSSTSSRSIPLASSSPTPPRAPPPPPLPHSPTPTVRFAPSPSRSPTPPPHPPLPDEPDYHHISHHLLSSPLTSATARPFSPPPNRRRFFLARVLRRLTHPRDHARVRATAEAAAIAAARLSTATAANPDSALAVLPHEDDEDECWSDAELNMYGPAERDYASFSARSVHNYTINGPNSFRKERFRHASTDLGWRARTPRRRSLDERMGLAPRDFGSKSAEKRLVDDAGLRSTKSATTAVRKGRYRLRGSRGSGWLDVADRRVGDRDEGEGFGARREGAAGWKRKWRSLSVERKEKGRTCEDGGRCNSDPNVFKCGNSFQSESSENGLSASSVTQTGSHTSSFN